MTMQRPPRDFENLDFEIIEETWNKYELQNNTVVRARIIVTRFARDSRASDPNQIALSSQNLFVVDAHVEQRGEPTPPLTPEEMQNPTGGTPIRILTSNEGWNKYRILSTGLVLKVKMVVDDVIRLPNRFDNDGMPQFVFRSTPMVVPDRHQNPNVRT